MNNYYNKEFQLCWIYPLEKKSRHDERTVSTSSTLFHPPFIFLISLFLGTVGYDITVNSKGNFDFQSARQKNEFKVEFSFAILLLLLAKMPI